MKKSHLLIGLLALIWGAAQAQTATEAPDNTPSKEIVMSPWGKPYPYSAHSVFERLKTIIETPPEKLNYQLVEKVFETKLNVEDRAKKYGLPSDQWESSFIATSYAGQDDAYFTLTLVANVMPTKEQPDFAFSFQSWATIHSPRSRNDPMCISVELFKPLFKKMGWVGQLLQPRHGYQSDSRLYQFKKSPGHTSTVEYFSSTNCILRFQLAQQPVPERK
jgi:hypothetical protein